MNLNRLTHTERRNRFREILGSGACTYPANVYDPVSARIAELVGYEIGMLSGSVSSAIELAAPDLCLISLTELVGRTRSICQSTNLSLFVDADHGYGNALNVMRTVNELEDAGAAALTIEDVNLPNPFGINQPNLILQEEMLGKLSAAVAARRDSSLVIIARTSSLNYEAPEIALERIRQYSTRGVDGIFLAGTPRGKEDISMVHSITALPIFLARTPPNIRDDPEFLNQTNVKVGLEGHHPFLASIKALHDTMTYLKEGGKSEALEGQAESEKLLSQITRRQTFIQRQEQFLSNPEDGRNRL
ncbi:oxaloacetate decarboxylase [SAR202 cluster bacterium AD-802-E10_MRT_200m]|nr:oxaloacetate decarboxylase [SAR202 cluster bacterium AD-802-E10_MRT_200m]